MFLAGQFLGLLVLTGLAGCHQLQEERVGLAKLKTSGGVTSRKLVKAFQPGTQPSIYVDTVLGRVGRSVAREKKGMFQEGWRTGGLHCPAGSGIFSS